MQVSMLTCLLEFYPRLNSIAPQHSNHLYFGQPHHVQDNEQSEMLTLLSVGERYNTVYVNHVGSSS